MTTYYPYKLRLSIGQKKSLANAYAKRTAVVLRISSNQKNGSDEMLLTRTQINRLQKPGGMDLKISKSQIRKSIRRGGSLFSSLISFIPKLSPMATSILKPLGLGAMMSLGSNTVDKTFGKGVHNNIVTARGLQTRPYPSVTKGGFLIPNSKLDQLIKHKHLLTTAQKKKLLTALQSGSGLQITPSKVQRGGFLGTLIASLLGSVLLPGLMGGKGLQNRPYPGYKCKRGRGIQKKKSRGGRNPKKSLEGGGLLLGPNSPFKNIPLIGAIL